jgi:hypothetical protein
MNWLKRLFKFFGWELSSAKDAVQSEEPVKYHCIRFMTDKGEQVGILLTTEELERGLNRWVDTIQEMPIDPVDVDKDERIP